MYIPRVWSVRNTIRAGTLIILKTLCTKLATFQLYKVTKNIRTFSQSFGHFSNLKKKGLSVSQGLDTAS